MAKKWKRVLALALCIVIVASFVGCGNTTQNGETGTKKVNISICWPSKNSGAQYEQYEKWLAEFNEKYPNVEVTREDWQFTTDTFLPKAASGTLPTLYSVPFTEVEKVVSGNYVADISKQLKEYGYLENLSDEMIEIITRNGKQYFVPVVGYVMGVFANVDMFEKAGLLDENGLVNFPDTYEELGEIAGIIKEKTGQAGLVLPTMNNCGGWHFMNIAWSFGTEFMAQESGKWKATFDSEEGISALQFVKDLKWKYKALSDNAFIDTSEMMKMFTQGQGAMYFASPSFTNMQSLKDVYGMNKDSVSIGAMPAGPAGKYALLGGNINCIEPNATEEQKNAAFDWLAHIGYGANVTEEFKKGQEDQIKAMAAEECAVGVHPYNIWKAGEIYDYTEELLNKYKNIDENKFKEYVALDGVTIRAEEPINCQELYSILDACIQEVLINENADCAELMKKAASDFQLNYLNNIE